MNDSVVFNLSSDEIIMLAYGLEYDYNGAIQNKINKILEKIENELHVDTYVGNKLFEYGRIMGWQKER